MTALIEYLVRIRVEEPTAELSAGESSEAMALLLSEVEVVALEQKVVSRTVLDGPDSPSRVRCAARSLDPSRHYATTTRYTLTTPNDERLAFCSAACSVSWLCREGLPADVEATAQQAVGKMGSEAAA